MSRQAGAFVWFEHLSSDPARAQRFQAAAFGHAVEASRGGLGGAARWVAHASVEDVDRAVDAVVGAGGRIVSPPVQLPGIGRMARVADAEGAVFGLVRLDREDPEATPFAWNELWTPEPGRVLELYTRVLGVAATPVGMGHYHFLRLEGRPRAGVLRAPLCRPGWLPYLRVDSCDEALERALRAGASLEHPPTEVRNIGRLAILRDPLGARLGLLAVAPLGHILSRSSTGGAPLRGTTMSTFS